MKVVRSVPRIALNRTEVALAIGVSANTVDAMVKEGALPPARKWHSRKVWLVAEIEAALMEWPTAPAMPEEENEDWTMIA